MRILVADDHPMFRLAVREILARHYRGVEIVEAAGAPDELIDVIDPLELPDSRSADSYSADDERGQIER